MDSTEKVILIRRANEFFNAKDYKNALKIFIGIGYKEGIGRIAAVMEHEKKDRIAALKLYRQAGMLDNVEKLSYEMAQTVRLMVKEDREKAAAEDQTVHNAGFKLSGQSPPLNRSSVAKDSKKIGVPIKDLKGFLHDREILLWKPKILRKDDSNK